MTDYSSLSNSDLNRLVAERVMGYEIESMLPDDDGYAWVSSTDYVVNIDYCDDHASIDRMEERIQKMGKPCSSRVQDHPFMLYTLHLMEIVGIADGWDNGTYTGNPHDFWLLLRATPRQRCIAALKAVVEE